MCKLYGSMKGLSVIQYINVQLANILQWLLDVTSDDVPISAVNAPLKPILIDLANSDPEDSKSTMDIKIKREEEHEKQHKALTKRLHRKWKTPCE